MFETEFPGIEDEETILIQQDALRDKLNALLGLTPAPAAEPQADLQDLLARLRGRTPSVAPTENPFSDQLTDGAFQRVMDSYRAAMRDGQVKPGDRFYVQPAGDDGRLTDGPPVHFDTRTGRPTLAPSTLPEREVSPVDVLRGILNHDFRKPRPLPRFLPSPPRGDAVPFGPFVSPVALPRRAR